MGVSVIFYYAIVQARHAVYAAVYSGCRVHHFSDAGSLGIHPVESGTTLVLYFCMSERTSQTQRGRCKKGYARI